MMLRYIKTERDLRLSEADGHVKRGNTKEEGMVLSGKRMRSGLPCPHEGAMNGEIPLRFCLVGACTHIHTHTHTPPHSPTVFTKEIRAVPLCTSTQERHVCKP